MVPRAVSLIQRGKLIAPCYATYVPSIFPDAFALLSWRSSVEPVAQSEFATRTIVVTARPAVERGSFVGKSRRRG